MVDESSQSGFYEISAYRSNIRRYKDGIDQLNELQTMLKERADIELSYAKSLQSFHTKWTNLVSKAPSSEVRSIWLNVLEEVDELQNLHSNVKERISDELAKAVMSFLKDNHHPTPFRASKEVREIEEDFEKAQRPWRKHYDKVEKAKKAFHLASKAERSVQIQVKNASGDSTISADGESKYRERYKKCQEELTATEKVYRLAINDLMCLKSNYVSRMKDVFEICQQKELKRLKFLFEILSRLQNVLVNIASASRLNQLHRLLEASLMKRDEGTHFEIELNDWSNRFGPGSSIKWPEFEPYKPSLHHIVSKEGKIGAGEVILTKKTIRTDDDFRGSICSSASNKQNDESENRGNDYESHAASNGEKVLTASTNSPLGSDDMKQNGINQPNTDESSAVVTPTEMFESTNQQLPFSSFNDSTAKNIVQYLVRVLYDYEARESDELSLKKGDTIEVLSKANRLNWAFGRKNGRDGLFPALYVERL